LLERLHTEVNTSKWSHVLALDLVERERESEREREERERATV